MSTIPAGHEENRSQAPLAPRHQLGWDVALASALGIATAVVSLLGSSHIDPILYSHAGNDAWFDADIPRTFGQMAGWPDAYTRIPLHPLFALLARPLVFMLTAVLGVETVTAVRWFMAAVALLWGAALFILFRRITGRRLDAAVFCVLAMVSASALFWFTVPETFAFGSMTVAVALAFCAVAQHRALSPLWYVVASGLTLCGTVSNWMVGVLVTAVDQPWRRTIKICTSVLVAAAALLALQYALYPIAGPLLDLREWHWVFHPEALGFPEILRVFFIHSVVMPEIGMLRPPAVGELPLLRVQMSAAGSASTLGALGVISWFALLALGGWTIARTKQHPRLRIAVVGSLFGQCGLHLVYGAETFVYSAHWLPILIAVAAFGSLSRARTAALVLALSTATCAAVNNASQFTAAMDRVSHTVVAPPGGGSTPDEVPDRDDQRAVDQHRDDDVGIGQ